MFVSLHSILKQAGEITVKMTVDPENAEQVIVVVSPKHRQGEKHQALNQPVLFKNTPAVLDAEFPAALAELTPHYEATSNSVAVAIKALDDAKATASKKPAPPSKPGSKPTPAAKAEPAKAVDAQPSLFLGIATDSPADSTSTAETSSPEGTTAGKPAEEAQAAAVQPSLMTMDEE